jgi:hypothetical protein
MKPVAYQWYETPAYLPPHRLSRKLSRFVMRWHPIRIVWMDTINIYEFRKRCNRRHRLSVRRLKRGLYP